MILRFTGADLDRFARASHDCNPLHMAAAYARRTPWGERVVFGVLGGLHALAALRERRDRALERLTLDFSGAMFLDTDYEVRVGEDTGDLAKARIHDGRRTLLKLSARFRARGPAPAPDAGPLPPLRTEAIDRDAGALVPGLAIRGRFAPEAAAFRDLIAALALDQHGVPAGQAATLLAMSYLVGMELPGRRALFSALAIDFPADAPVDTHFGFAAQVEAFDPRFALATIPVELRGPGVAAPIVARARLSTLVRAVLAPPTIARLAEVLPVSNALAGRVAVVTGASRGLGAAITQALLSQGCTVHGNHRQSDAEMGQLAEAARALPGTLLPWKGDAADPGFCAELRARLGAAGGLDLLVCNATPPIRPLGFEAATVARANAFIRDSVALTSVPLGALVDLIDERRGTVVAISSSMVESCDEGWAHYVAAKAAVEGLLRVVASERPRVRFLVYRPPPLATDQTNTPIAGAGKDALLAPEVVAVRLVRDLLAAPDAGRVQLVDHFT